jgi:PAS domain S-box-containing protein
MVPNESNHREKRLSVRDYLSSKFQFIHLRLAKIYSSMNQTLDLPALEAAAKTFIEDLPLAVFFSSLEGRFLYCNRRSEELSGYPREEVVGRLYYQAGFVSLNDLIKLASLYASRAFDHSLGPYRFTLIRKDGRRIRVEILTHLTSFGESRIVMSLAREVDELNLKQEEGDEEGDLQRRLSLINKGMSPISICMDCKKVQAAEDEWIPIEYFLYKQLEIEFSHGYCPQCFEKRKAGEL